MKSNKTNSKEYLSYKDAKLKMEKYCIYQDRCHFDVEKKLRSFGLTEDISNQIIMDLIQDNFLNEERFVHSFVHGKFNQKKWGKNKITFELKKRNIHKNLIKTSLNKIDTEAYYETLKELYQKKYKAVSAKNHFLKTQKVIRYLLNRGFEYQLIKDVIEDF